jgi:hypothetical protein
MLFLRATWLFEREMRLVPIQPLTPPKEAFDVRPEPPLRFALGKESPALAGFSFFFLALALSRGFEEIHSHHCCACLV